MALRWKIYAFLYSLIVLLNAYFSLSRTRPIYTYYQVLILIDRSHWADLVFFYFSNIIEVISLVPLFLFVFKTRFLSQQFWRLIFFGRIIGLLAGRDYEHHAIKSLFYANPTVITTAVIVAVIAAVPSFAGQYLYAFRKNDYTD